MRRLTLARQPWLWAFVGVWAVFVSALHFGGLAYNIYTKVWWWDLLTHSLSGFGVAGVLYLAFPRTFTRRHAPVIVGGAVLAIGAGFEVYEYLFKDFWYGWSMAYYVEDTIVDLVVDTVGALGFVVLVNTMARRMPSPSSQATHERPRTERAGDRLAEHPAKLRSDGGDRSGATDAPSPESPRDDSAR
ncbi:hypothetical protein ACH9L7_01915 [Haloferax sp. S1W]|uniref:hypothetical protein n=1 Tax=Haloferax sp. S1W TaxID=3377110 RepID=UPI0037C91C6C